MNAMKMIVLVFVALLPAGICHAGLSDIVGDKVAESVVDRMGLHVDIGVEGAMLATGTEHGAGAAAELDLVIAMFDDQRMAKKPRVRDRVLAQALGRPRPPSGPWPALARPRLEAHVGGVLDVVDGDRKQLHVSAGSNIDGVGLAASSALEWNDRGRAWAIGPELRLRHRYGPRERSPSV